MIDWIKAKPRVANMIEKTAVQTMKKTFGKAFRLELDRAVSTSAKANAK